MRFKVGDIVTLWAKKYREENKERLNQYSKEYRKTHRLEILQYLKIHGKYRRDTDMNFRLTVNLRNRLHHSLIGHLKADNTMKLIGCSVDKLKKYLASKFKKGMSWNNYGKWEIDHIIPCAKFDFSKEEEQRKCFHYTNLQPLWEQENLVKTDK